MTSIFEFLIPLNLDCPTFHPLLKGVKLAQCYPSMIGKGNPRSYHIYSKFLLVKPPLDHTPTSFLKPINDNCCVIVPSWFTARSPIHTPGA